VRPLHTLRRSGAFPNFDTMLFSVRPAATTLRCARSLPTRVATRVSQARTLVRRMASDESQATRTPSLDKNTSSETWRKLLTANEVCGVRGESCWRAATTNAATPHGMRRTARPRPIARTHMLQIYFLISVARICV
jgi:hypothetical protein